MSKLSKALAGVTMALALPAAAQTPPQMAPKTAQSAFVDVPGGKLWYETCGSGPKTMVLLHDGLLHSVAWDDVWPGLCNTFHVVRYDRRGYGRSPEAKAPYSPVEDVAAVMKAAGMEHATIVGASNGGGIAIDFTLTHPKQVDRLVVVGPDFTGYGYSSYFMGRMAEEQASLAKGDLAGALRNSWVLARGDDANIQRLLALETASPQDMNHQDPATPSPPAAPRLGQIKAPTLVLIGEDDVADNQAKAGVIQYAVPRVQREVIRKAGHLLYMEQPAEFVDIVTRFADPASAKQASPGAQAALERVLGELRQGGPDYPSLAPALAKILASRKGAIDDFMAKVGAFKSATFDSVRARGVNVFVVAFEKASIKTDIAIGPDGKVYTLQFEPPH